MRAILSIPTSLYGRLEEKIKGTQFHSVSSYVTHILRKLISEEEEGEKPFTEEEEEKIKQNLKSLGYLE